MRMKREHLRALYWFPSSLAHLVPCSCWACVWEQVVGPVFGCPLEGPEFPPGVVLGFTLTGSRSCPCPACGHSHLVQLCLCHLRLAIVNVLALATVLVGVALATALATGVPGLKIRRGALLVEALVLLVLPLFFSFFLIQVQSHSCSVLRRPAQYTLSHPHPQVKGQQVGRLGSRRRGDDAK